MNDNDFYASLNTYFPGEVGGYPVLDNPSLNMSGDAIPYAHAARLSDKLFGAVEMALDNVTYNVRLTNLRNDATMRQVAGQTTYLPQALGAWFYRNMNLLMIAAFGLFAAWIFVRVRK